jgi:ATP-binding cassette subfamily A (ABC1) protein 3
MTVSKKPNANEGALLKLMNTLDHHDLLSNAAGEISFRLPFSQAKNFPALFRQLDERMAEWGMESYGISVTTLEEVFLRVGRDEEDVEERKKNRALEASVSTRGVCACVARRPHERARPQITHKGTAATVGVEMSGAGSCGLC